MTARPPILFLLFAVACETETVNSGEQLHPTEQNAPPSDAIALTSDSVPPGLARDRRELWLGARERLMRARTIAHFGSEDEGPELFGKVKDARVDQEGRLVVLDEQTSEVRVFAPDGTYLHGFGKFGDGPLEMRQTRGLELLGPNRLAVYYTLGKAKVFARTAGQWQLESIVTLPVTVEDNCTFPDRIFLHGIILRPRGDPTLFYEMGQLGDTAPARYGRGYQDDLWMVRDILSFGEIACVPALSQVVFAFQLLPLVRSYSAETGDVLWSAYVEDYIQRRLVEVPEQGALRNYHGLPNDLLATALTMPSGHVVLQYRRHGDQLRIEAVRTYLLDPETGHGSLISDELPEIESFYEGGYVALFEDPYPRIEVRAFPASKASGRGS